MSAKIRVLLIEDSSLMRLVISDMLSQDTGIEVVGTATNGQEGVAKVLELTPDVVVTDMVMPNYDGVYAVKQIMSQKPTPIVLLSALEKADPKVFEALEEGAVDFIDKPKARGISEMRDIYLPLVTAVRNASMANVSRSRLRLSTLNRPNVSLYTKRNSYNVVCIGASTGGPGALEELLFSLPNNFPLPIVVVQHMPENFLISFAERLNYLLELKVKVIRLGESLLPGVVYVAPGHTNMRLVKDITGNSVISSFTNKEFKEFNFPSVDCLFYSVAELYKNEAIGVILSGMGRDGVDGLKAMNDFGALTIAQDKSTSIVFGMPKCAIEIGAAKHVLKINEIGSFIVKMIS